MLKWAKELFPLCRSITGNGTRSTLNYFKAINKEFKILKFKSGTKVFDWVIPQEWNIKDAYIEHESKKKFAEFKKSEKLINTISQIPVNNLLIETDSPYLSPSPYRGKENEPSFIKYTLEKLAEIKKITTDELSNITTNNFQKLFNIK